MRRSPTASPPRTAPRSSQASCPPRWARTTARRSLALEPGALGGRPGGVGAVLDTVERAELRDTEVASIRDGIETRFAGDLSAAETSLGAALIQPLVVPNSSFSEELTAQARSRAAEAVADVVKAWERGETIVRSGDRVDEVALEAIDYFQLNTGGLDVARLVGFIVLSVLVIGLLLTWTWRFRREFWHRNNVLLLLSLLLLIAVFALKLTVGRPWLPYALPLAAVGMILAVLLDAGVAMVMTALIALLAAAVNGTGTTANTGVELAAYVLLGGWPGSSPCGAAIASPSSSRPGSPCSW